MEKLKHKFGDDGVFYISFEDMLKRFDMLDRVRLFNGDDWYNSQVWTSVSVPWMASYLDNVKFVVDVTEPGVFIFALSQVSLVFPCLLKAHRCHNLTRHMGSSSTTVITKVLKGNTPTTFTSSSGSLDPTTTSRSPARNSAHDPLARKLSSSPGSMR